ncbi:hypothetical protein F4813DRAFT_356663 [Daldinia decipiens]|uniref:uncharacterized protein n=1 Tax=Daldinia decipiens TaxID=326647 RepID=UPI0020C2FF9E|nr:uncharacterized protein F4813DRAFT_356663 [Daldinia decipiens]KAI1658394.1 hypothetical protein F4813DRAFT_356663 [Daldinia decipiens]
MEAQYSLLWLHGRPGCGKSTLISRIIESISQNQFATRGPNTIHLLYFYVGLGDGEGKDTLYQKMLMTFWEQATGEKPSDTSKTGKDAVNQLHDFLASSQRDIYLVIDALDQLPPYSQQDILKSLGSLVQKLKDGTNSCRLSVAISSRDRQDIHQLGTYKRFQIEVTPEKNKRDIERYLGKCLDRPRFEERQELQARVFDYLSKNADGMFLWASLQALNFCDMELDSQISDALDNLIPPQKLHDTYKSHAESFEALLDPFKQKVTWRTMALLAHNEGSLPTEVILTAASLNDNGEVNQEHHQDLAKNLITIVRFCSHLVQINENLGTFQFCHRTAFEFFRGYNPTVYHYRIADLCLSHLSSSDFSQGPQNDARWYSPGSLGVILQDHPFLTFASLKWATSIKRSFSRGASLEGSYYRTLCLLKLLLDKETGVKRKGNLQLAFQVYFFKRGKTMSSRVCHEHIISYFSLVELIDVLKNENWFDQARLDSDGLSPIHWAIRNDIDHEGAASTVGVLIRYGVDINATDKEGRSPLWYAAYYGNEEATKLLIRHHAKLDLKTQRNETALIAACKLHHENIISHLTNAEANVEVQSESGTALQFISLTGCCSCAERILNGYGTSKIIEYPCEFGSSLHAAAFYGHLDLVKLLCSRRTNFLRIVGREHGSPITAAAAGFSPGLDSAPFIEIIEELINHGVDVNKRGGVVGPALRAAAAHGSLELVRFLIDKGAKVHKAIGPMGTVYEAAEEYGHQGIKDHLLSKDANAARYGQNRTRSSYGRQEFQRVVFRAAVKMVSMDTIDILVTQMEKFYKQEFEKGETALLRGLAKLSRDSFQDVVKLATESQDRRSMPTKGKHNRSIARFRNNMLDLFCIPIFKIKDSGLAQVPTTYSLGQDDLEHLPQVLDRMTQAAVKIMEDAIASGKRDVIRLMANAWIEALNNLISYPGFGEPMLELVVQRRANELKERLTNPNVGEVARFGETKALAQVGIELLLIAVERGQKFKHLSFVISKLWIEAVNDIEGLGEKGERPVKELIRLFSERFSHAVMIHDQVNARICLQAGVEFVRAAALSANKTLLNKFTREWLRWWELIVEKNMESMVKGLVDQRWKECQECLKGNMNDKALGLALTAIGILQTGIEYKNGPLGEMIRPVIESSFQLMQENFLGDAEFTRLSDRDLDTVSDALIDLFATAEEIQPGSLNTLALKMLDCAITSSRNYQKLLGIIERHVRKVDQIASSSDREKQSIQIFRIVVMFINVALCAAEPNSSVLPVLKKMALENLAAKLPNFTERGELVPYTRAIAYLKSEDH